MTALHLAKSQLRHYRQHSSASSAVRLEEETFFLNPVTPNGLCEGSVMQGCHRMAAVRTIFIPIQTCNQFEATVWKQWLLRAKTAKLEVSDRCLQIGMVEEESLLAWSHWRLCLLLWEQQFVPAWVGVSKISTTRKNGGKADKEHAKHSKRATKCYSHDSWNGYIILTWKHTKRKPWSNRLGWHPSSQRVTVPTTLQQLVVKLRSLEVASRYL